MTAKPAPTTSKFWITAKRCFYFLATLSMFVFVLALQVAADHQGRMMGHHESLPSIGEFTASWLSAILVLFALLAMGEPWFRRSLRRLPSYVRRATSALATIFKVHPRTS